MLLAEPEHDSSAEPEVVLRVVEPIRDFCQEVLGLHRANREVLGEFHVNSPTGCKMVLPSNLLNPRARQYPSQKQLNEGRKQAVADVYPRPNR